MKKINGWLYAFWIALIVILIMVLAVGLISWAGSGAEESADGDDSEGGGDGEGSGSGDTGSGGGSTGTYEYMLTLEAEDAGLFNPVGKEDGSMSGILKTEAIDSSDSESGTCVANFKTAGDMIVFDVYADAATTVDVSITANYCYVSLSGSGTDFDASTHSIFYVNGTESTNLVTLSGTLTYTNHPYGTLTASDVSLVKGVNYLILTCTSVEASTMGFMNVDKMEIGWNGTASITETTVGEGDGAKMSVATEVTKIDAASEYAASIEAENAALADPVGKEDSGTSGILKTEAIDSSDPESGTCVANFKTAGDMIVFDVYADAATTVDVSITANYSLVQIFTSNNFDASAHSIFYVNGMETDNLVTLSGTLDKDHSYGTLTASDVSLVKGINYLILTCTSAEANTMGFMNVDRIDLNGGTYKEPATEVSSADELVEALEEGGDIVLTTDITVGEEAGEADTAALTVSEDTEIDLAGKSISTADSLSSALNTIEVSGSATLTIIDSTGEGSIANTYTGTNGNTSTDNAAAIAVAEGGTLVIESGTITSSSIGVRAEGVDSTSNARATVTIDGGEISSTYFSVFASGDVDVTINGGTISGTSKGICIDGDSDFGYGSNGAYNYGTTTTLTVTGGEISCTNDSAICTLGGADASSAVITISGGTISNSATVTGSGTSITAPPAVYVPNGTLTITGGTITSTLTAVEIRGGTAKISGGTFITTYNDANGAGDDATQSTFGAKTYGYALSVYAYGVNTTINKRMENTNDNYSNDVNVTVTGGTFVGDIYVAAEAEYSVNNEAKWTVVLNGTEEEKANAPYVVTMTGIEFVGYTSSGEVAGEQDTVSYYLYAVDSKLAAIDETSDATDLVYSGDESVEGYDYEIVISTDAFDGSVKYTLVGEAGTMDETLAAWFGNGAAAGDAYVTVKLYVGTENTLTYTSAGGEEKTIDSSDLTSDGYYIFAYRLTGTLGDGTTAVSPSSAKEYTISNASGETLYTVTIDYTQVTITEAV